LNARLKEERVLIGPRLRGLVDDLRAVEPHDDVTLCKDRRPMDVRSDLVPLVDADVAAVDVLRGA
jgi:hypothetical protein